MALFNYKAVDKEQKIVTGSKEAPNEYALADELKKDGLVVLSAEPVGKVNSRAWLKKLSTMGRISMHEKIILNRNLSAMLEAGLPLSRALAIIEHQSKNPKLKKVISEISEGIKKGESLSVAMARYPKIFSPILISMLQAGEESGKLIDALNVVADQMDKTYTLQKKVQGAMVYPGVIITAMVGIGIFMLIYVVPTLSDTFADLEVELPPMTLFVIALSNFFKTQYLLLLGIILVLVFTFSMLIKSPAGRKPLNWLILRIPVVSGLVKEINAARTTRTLASLLAAGVPYVRALQIVQDVIQNEFYKEVLQKAEKNIQLGLPISGVFAEAEKLYPIFVSEMMAVGEETGELGPMLYKVAIFYEEEVDQKTKNMSTIIEPVLMIIVGAAVGFFALSMITPMYSLVNKI